MMRKLLSLSILLLTVALAACSNISLAPEELPTLAQLPTPLPATVTSTATNEPTQVPPSPTMEQVPASPTISPTPTATPRTPPPPDAWMSLPIVPTISARTIAIYQIGIGLGNNPKAFSKVGDCGSTPAWFLGDFDYDPSIYRLGDYQSLEAVIEVFQGSFSRRSLAAKSGFNASAALSPLWSDREQCVSVETPLECEYRVHKPAFVLIMLGTNDVYHQEKFEPQMREIIELTIERGVVPVLSTKADNLEGDNSVNAAIAQLAWEYDIPLWNFWAATRSLPEYGLQEDGAHLTWGRNFFDDAKEMERAWPVRNLTALQMLDALWRATSDVK